MIRKKLFKTINILFLILWMVFVDFSVLGCKSTSNYKTEKKSVTEKPSWIENPEKSSPSSLFLSAVGIGYTEQDARSNAAVALATTIQQNISSTLTTKTSESLANNKSASVLASVDETIKTATIVDDLVGIYIKEYWSNPNGAVYALAQINRSEATAYYTQQINNNNKIISDNLRFADKAGSNFDSFAYIQKSIPLAQKNRNYFTILSVINNSAFNTLELISPEELSNISYKAASKISIGIFVDKDKNDLIYSTLAKVFTSYGFIVGKATDSNYPYLLNAKLSFVTNKGLRYIEVNCHSDISLIDANTKMAIVSDSYDDRISHKDEFLAESRAYTVLEEYILEKYKLKFESFVQNR